MLSNQPDHLSVPPTAKVLSTREINEHIVETLVHYLRQKSDSKTPISYLELSEQISSDVRQSKNRALLTKARRICQEDYSLFFRTINNVGLERVRSDDQVKLVSSTYSKRLESAATGWRRDQDCIDVRSLTDAGVTDYITSSVRLAYIEEAVSAQTKTAIEGAVATVQSVSPSDNYQKLIQRGYQEMKSVR